MEHANARDETSVENREELPDRRLTDDSEKIAEETEYLPYTPGDDLPDEVKEILREAASEEAASPGTSPEAPHSAGVPDTVSADDGGSATDEPADELEEIRSIFLGHAATGQLDMAQVAANLSDRIESTRRELVEEVRTVECRIREEIKSAAADLLSEVEHRALLSRSADETARSVDELLNLVSVTQGNLRAELEQLNRATKSSLDDVLSLVRELACTLAIMIGGEDEGAPDLEETIVPETAHRGSVRDVDVPLLTELPVVEEAVNSASGGADRARGPEEETAVEPPNRPSDAAKFYF